MLTHLLDLVLHLDVHLANLSVYLGPWLYALLFGIIFCETGLVVTPFLPGDSLLFATGALASVGESNLNLPLIWILLIAAAFVGDNVNYSIGRFIGPRAFSQPKSVLFNPEHLREAQGFYDRHGGKTVFLARFLPILRTFAPFVAGVGHMSRKRFMMFSLSGSIVWISLFLFVGNSFGNIPWVKRNFSALIMALIILSLLPILYTATSKRLRPRAQPSKG